jgi:hypothetical protein
VAGRCRDLGTFSLCPGQLGLVTKPAAQQLFAYDPVGGPADEPDPAASVGGGQVSGVVPPVVPIGATMAPDRAHASTSAFTCHQFGSRIATTSSGLTPSPRNATAKDSTCSWFAETMNSDHPVLACAVRRNF